MVGVYTWLVILTILVLLFLFLIVAIAAKIEYNKSEIIKTQNKLREALASKQEDVKTTVSEKDTEPVVVEKTDDEKYSNPYDLARAIMDGEEVIK